MTTFIAKYAAGACSDCSGQISPGEEIARNLDQDYVHVDCPETGLDRLAGKPVCLSCWMVGPCDCD